MTDDEPLRWGRWRYDAKKRDLVYGDTEHAVDLDSCLSAAQVLHWIGDMSYRPWCSKEDLADLVRALDALLGGLLWVASRPRPLTVTYARRVMTEWAKMVRQDREALARRRAAQ